MSANLTDTEKAVLAAIAALTRADAEGAWNPYYADVAAAAHGNSDLAYTVCKALKKAGLVEANGRQGTNLLNAPAYWATEKGLEVVPA